MDNSGNQNHGTIYGAEWVENEVLGCTDSLATNYDLLANINDGSCCYSTGDSIFQIGQDIYGEIIGNTPITIKIIPEKIVKIDSEKTPILEVPTIIKRELGAAHTSTSTADGEMSDKTNLEEVWGRCTRGLL